MPVETTENYVRVRVRDVGDFQEGSLRTITISKDKGIKAVIGRLKGETTTTVQAYLFDKDKWSEAEAEAWVREHKEKGMMEICKIDEEKQIVYGCFLVPMKEDLQGDIISEEDVEKVAHNFLMDYREFDEMHSAEKADAQIVESFLAPQQMDFYGKVYPKGCWLGAVKVTDAGIWEKIKHREYRGFSVKIHGERVRE